MMTLLKYSSPIFIAMMQASPGIAMVPPGDANAPMITQAPRLVPRASEENLAKDLYAPYGPLWGALADSKTCGYLDGYSGNPYTCPDGRNCVLLSQGGDVAGYLGCCKMKDNSCNVITKCVNGADYYKKDVCDDKCRSETSKTTHCTYRNYSVCNTITWGEGNITAYKCDSTKYASARTFDTTYGGQSSELPQYTTVSAFLEVFTTAYFGTPWEDGYWGDGPQTWIPDGYYGSYTSSPPSPTPSDGGSSSEGPSTGVIIGGVLGGAAVLGAVVIAVVWLFLRERRERKHRELEMKINAGLGFKAELPLFREREPQELLGEPKAYIPKEAQEVEGSPVTQLKKDDEKDGEVKVEVTNCNKSD